MHVQIKPVVLKPVERIIEKPVIVPVPIPSRQKLVDFKQPEVPAPVPEAEAGRPPAEPLPPIIPAPEVEPEEKSSTQPEMEEKSSDPEEKSSSVEVGSKKRRKLKKFSGAGGRIHTEAQIDEILDFWLMTGELPNYVSERQRWSYRHHDRVPERREFLEQRGISIVASVPGTTGHTPAVIPIERAKSQRKTGTGE